MDTRAAEERETGHTYTNHTGLLRAVTVLYDVTESKYAQRGQSIDTRAANQKKA